MAEALKAEYVMLHKITRWVDQSGKIIEEHSEDAEPDADSENLWDVWVRAGKHGEQPDELEEYAGQFKTHAAASMYATTLAAALNVEIDEY